ncbi:hypothetical protein QBC34DRAFT_402062 [Podospora aff. communis PSN243]|uniref:Glycoside Hydrolase Family 61 n=1 Tax=Podospora aff. communis PSN243 TaxID=3040156 RepID=A0AAV9GTE0_9PEZI|nr:hypothetical protein QBC34DRAFT_402062 [Podospora aff. communis PSN243]
MKPVAVILAGCGLASALAVRQPYLPSASSHPNRYKCGHKSSSIAPSVTPSSISSVVVSSISISSISVSAPSSVIPSVSVPLSSIIPSVSVPLSSIIPSISVPLSSVIPSISVSVPPVSSIVPSSVIPSVVPSSSIVQPPLNTCELGTAMGYQEGDSVTLNTQPGQGCNRWGWYETPTLAELQVGISGTLYVGAGGNNIDNAINVGDWTAVASPTGGVTFTYALDPGYFLDEVHIDLDCLPIDTCAPGQYTFNSGALPNVAVYINPTPLQYPTCSGGSQAYIILHGSVNYVTTNPTCAPPVAT